MESSRQRPAIPPEVAAVLRPVLPELADDTIAAIAREVPGYRHAMEGKLGEVVRIGVERALGRFVDLIEDPAGEDVEKRGTYVRLGKGEVHSGRSLETLLAAYRVGARVAWRRFVDACVAADQPPEVVFRLGEAIFEYIDELSALSAEGYAAEQMVEAGERRRRRRRLVLLCAQDHPAPEDAIRTAAEAAGWELPKTVAAVVAQPPAEREEDPERTEGSAERLARGLGHGAIGAAVGPLACALMPDPLGPGRRRLIEAAVQAESLAPTVLGSVEPWERVGVSVRRAVALHRLLASGRVEAESLVDASRHLPQLLLASDPVLATDLAVTSLAPLRALPETAQHKLAETLRAWLDRPGQIQAIGEEIGVHPQTVRYRVKQLRDLFGDRLDDAESRFELALALRV